MNIWTYLGLPSDHRAEDKVVQLVRHHDDVIKKVKGARIAQIKKDGVFAIIISDCNRSVVFGRTGKALSSLEHMQVRSVSPRGRVAFIAELCCDLCSLEELSGIVNPNRKKPLDATQQGYIDKAYFACHDMLYINELIEGVSGRGYLQRYLDLTRNASYIEHIHGLILMCLTCETEAEMEEFAQTCIVTMKEEGAVYKDPEAGWVAGRKNEVATKKVKGVDYDLMVVGIKEGKKGKHKGMVGKLLVRWRAYGVLREGVLSGASVLPVDGCFTQPLRKEWFANPALIIGKIVHVHALCIGSKGALRQPKVKTVRIDKSVADL